MPDEQLKQTEFDFARGRQLAILRESQLPPTNIGSRNVSGRTMKSLLLAIDSRAGKSGNCWASAATLAADCGISTRSAERALKGLQTLSLIIETPIRRGRSTCHDRRICWVNLLDHLPDAGSQPGSEPADPGSETNHFQIEREDLTDPVVLESCYRQAIERGDLKECDAARLAVFGFGARCARYADQLSNPPGFFLHGLKQGIDWLFAQVDDAHDRQAGRDLMRKLDRPADLDQAGRESAATWEVEAAEYHNQELERERQLAALAEQFPELKRGA